MILLMCLYELFTHTDLLTNFVIVLNWTELFANKFQLFVSQKGCHSLRKAGRRDRKSICGQKTGHETGKTFTVATLSSTATQSRFKFG